MHLSALHQDDFRAFVTFFFSLAVLCLIIVKHDSLLHVYGILIVQIKLEFRTTCRKRPRQGQDREGHVNRTCRQNARPCWL